MSIVVGLAGSLRRDSYNAALLRAASELAPPDMTLEVATIAGIPLYDGDQEAEHGVPDTVTALKQRVTAADALLIATPEYNSSIPGPFKNAIDWLSRPSRDIATVFGGKPVGVIGATPGRGGTRLAQIAWLPVLRTLGMVQWSGRQLYVAGAGQAFDGDGRLVDEQIREQLARYLAGFQAFVAGR